MEEARRMEVPREMLDKMNAAYGRLELKLAELAGALLHRIFTLESGWYNGHYNRGPAGEWVRDAYPIPVLEVKGLCDIEIGFDRITVSTKLRRARALEYPYEKLGGYAFEAYGVEDYLADFYSEGRSFDELRENIWRSGEKEIGFSFAFPFDTDGRTMLEFAKLLRREGFYY